MKTRLVRRKGFQCLHRYVVPEWTNSANASTFGLCFLPEGHGHNYELEVSVEGELDQNTGMVMNLADLDKILEKVIVPLDGKHINLEVPELEGKVPTTERLAHFLWEKLTESIPGLQPRLAKLRLYEYEDLWVDVWPD